MKLRLTILAIVFVQMYSFAQIREMQQGINKNGNLVWPELPAEPGKCYAKCLMPLEKAEPSSYTTTKQKEDGTQEYRTVIRCHVQAPKGHTEWREVICEKDVNEGFIKELQVALSQNGFSDEGGQLDYSWNPEIRANLVNYQRAYQLPIGQLDIETLNHLGMEW